MRAALLLLLTADIGLADVVITANSRIEGTISMPDSQTVAVALLGGSTKRIRAEDVLAVLFDGAPQLAMYKPWLDALGVPARQTTFPKSGSVLTSGIPWSPLYQAEMCDPAMAGLLSALVPTLGHVYAGQGGAGVGFLAGEVAEGVGGWFLWDRLGNDTSFTTSRVIFKVAGGVCLAALSITRICECADAIGAANRYNRELRNRLGLELGLLEHPQEVACGLNWRF